MSDMKAGKEGTENYVGFPITIVPFFSQVSEGTFGGAPTSYYDLWRIENGKVTEHWDVMETIAEKDTWQNQNGKF